MEIIDIETGCTVEDCGCTVEVKGTALLLPRVVTNDLTKNENLLTSKLVEIINLCNKISETLDFDKVVLDDQQDFKLIISSWCGDELEALKLKYPNKDIFEFSYCGLNAGWFLDRYTVDNVTFDNSRAGNDFLNIEYLTQIRF